MNTHGRIVLIDRIAGEIHRRSGHVEDHEGEVGGCHRAAEEIVRMFPADVVGAREDLEDLGERTLAVIAERDAIHKENARLRALLASPPPVAEPGAGAIKQPVAQRYCLCGEADHRHGKSRRGPCQFLGHGCGCTGFVDAATTQPAPPPEVPPETCPRCGCAIIPVHGCVNCGAIRPEVPPARCPICHQVGFHKLGCDHGGKGLAASVEVPTAGETCECSRPLGHPDEWDCYSGPVQPPEPAPTPGVPAVCDGSGWLPLGPYPTARQMQQRCPGCAKCKHAEAM